MQAERTTALIERLLQKAATLEPREMVLAGPVVVARGANGKLRCAAWDGVSARWWRGDFERNVRECLSEMLNPYKAGYFAARYRRDVEYACTATPLVAGARGVPRL
jgi:hypothetical protein